MPDETAEGFRTLSVGRDGPRGTLAIDRPDANNAISLDVLVELERAARWFDDRPDVAVVVVRGEGRWLSPGADLKAPPLEPARETADPWLTRREVGQAGTRAMDAIERMRAVTVARIHGAAVGGGLVLPLACDLRIASDDAVLSIPEVELGIPLTWGAVPRLVREIGPARTKELVMTCRRFTPAEAATMGLFNRVVPAAELDAAVDELVTRLLAMPPVPVRITKEQVNAATRAFSAATWGDGDVLLGVGLGDDSREAASAYVKRVFGSP